MTGDGRRLAGATVAVLAACFAAVVAWAANAIGSIDEAQSHETSLLIAQLVVAVGGLLPVALFARALVRRRDRQAAVWFVIAILAQLQLGSGVAHFAAD